MVSHDLHLVMAKTDEVLCLNQHIRWLWRTGGGLRMHPEFISMSYLRGAETAGIYRHHHNHRHDLQGRIVPASGNSQAMTESLRYLGWLAGMMLACAAGPLGLFGLAPHVLFRRHAGACSCSASLSVYCLTSIRSMR